MIRVGLTGGFATGKSFVAAELKRLGCHVIYADRLGHEVLEPSGEAFAPVVQAFGPDIVNGGHIDRKKLGQIVFGKPNELARLTAIVHPLVFALEEEWMERVAAQDEHAIAVVEAAILIETGRYREFDRLILTTCSERNQIARAMARDGLSEEQVQARLRQQMPIADKLQYAHYIVDTDGIAEETLAQVRAIYSDLREMA